MKKQTVITGFLAITFAAISITSVSAQTAADVNSTAGATVNSGGGLGTGLNSMVRNILGEDQQMKPVAPQAALMMEANTAADMSAPPAQARMMMKAESANATAFSMQAPRQTNEDVAVMIHTLLKNDGNLQSIDASDTRVRVIYMIRGMLFKFIPVTVPVTGEAYASGKTIVTYPWYASRVGIKSDIRSRFNARIAPQIENTSISPNNRVLLIGEIHTFFTEEFNS